MFETCKAASVTDWMQLEIIVVGYYNAKQCDNIGNKIEWLPYRNQYSRIIILEHNHWLVIGYRGTGLTYNHFAQF